MELDGLTVSTVLLGAHALLLLAVSCFPALYLRHRTKPLAHANPAMFVFILALVMIGISLYMNWIDYERADYGSALPLFADALFSIYFTFCVIFSAAGALMSVKTISRLRDWSNNFYE